MKSPIYFVVFSVAQIICLFAISSASGQTETLGIVRYKPPKVPFLILFATMFWSLTLVLCSWS